MNYQRGSILFLKAVIFLVAILVLSLCLFWLPGVAGRDAAAHPETAYLQYPFLVCAYVLSIPFFAALYQAFKLLSYVDQNHALSDLSVSALKKIKYCAITIGFFAVSGIAGVIVLAKGEDIAGIVSAGFMGIFASSIIAAFAHVLQIPLINNLNTKSGR